MRFAELDWSLTDCFAVPGLDSSSRTSWSTASPCVINNNNNVNNNNCSTRDKDGVRPSSLWIYIVSLRTQIHSQIKIHSRIKIHSQIDRCPFRFVLLGRHCSFFRCFAELEACVSQTFVEELESANRQKKQRIEQQMAARAGKHDEFVLKNEKLCIKYEDFVSKMMIFAGGGPNPFSSPTLAPMPASRCDFSRRILICC